MHRPRTRRLRVSLLLGATAVLFGVGFVGGQALDAERLWAQGDEPEPAATAEGEGDSWEFPGPEVTPEPGATPDTTKPFWYIPYENAERMKPKVQGELNGITVGVTDGPSLDCGFGGHLFGEEALAATKGTPFEINFDQLPDGVKPMVETAEVFLCEDGSPHWLNIDLDQRTLGSTRFHISIARWWGLTLWVDSGSAERWSTGTVAGRNAVFLDQIIPGRLGDASVIVLDPEIEGSTRIRDGSGTTPLSLLKQIAEAIYR